MQAMSDGATVSIAMHRDLKTGIWFVESLNMRFGEIRNTTSFAAPMKLSEAFTSEFCTFLQEHLPRTANPQVVALRDCVVQIEDLVLSGLRVMAQRVVGGVQKVIIRFREAYGAIHSFLAPRHRGYMEQMSEMQSFSAALDNIDTPPLDEPVAEIPEPAKHHDLN